MSDNRKNELVQKIRGGMQDRARYFACMYRSFSTVLSPEETERLAREAIREYGRIRAERDGKKITGEEWVDIHLSQMGDVFESKIEKFDDRSEQHMTHCALLEEWKQMGCTPEEQDLFCDIAMELDRSRAKSHGIPCEIRERLGKGDTFCRVVLGK